MGDTRERIRRLITLMPRLWTLFSDGGAGSLSDVAAAVGTDVETLTLDLHALEGVELDTEQSPNYFEFDLLGDELRVLSIPPVLSSLRKPIRVTPAEASALLGFLDEISLALEPDDDTMPPLVSAIAKAAGLPSGIRAWSADGPIPAQPIFYALVESAQSHTLCEIGYASDAVLKPRVVEPYHLRLESGFWYLIARLHGGEHDGEARTFRADKIASCTMLGTFEPRPVDLTAYANSIFTPQGEAGIARVAFSSQIAPYACERWGTGTPTADGRTVLEIEYHGSGWLARTLALFGAEFEVLAPADIRAEFHENAVEALKRY